MMKLLDRLRTQPGWQSDDPAVRVGAVRELGGDARELLLEIARHDHDPEVRRAAVETMPDLATLVEFLRDPGDDSAARAEAVAGVRETVIETTDPEVAAGALGALTDERDLAAVARSAKTETVARAALDRLAGDKAIGVVARRAVRAGIALDAVRRLAEDDELIAVASNADDKGPALAAFDRLTEGDGLDDVALETIARRTRHKSVARRARAALGDHAPAPEAEIEEGPAPGVDLCERLDSLAESMTTLEDGRRALDLAVQDWARLDGPVDSAVSERFAAARRTIEDRLLALDATMVEARRAAEELTAAESARAALCERIEILAGVDALDGVRQARAEWEALDAGPDGIDGSQASLDRLAERFEAAAVACETRHAEFMLRRERVRTLEQLVAELEQLVAEDAPANGAARWSSLEKAWQRELSATSRDDASPDAETDSALAALTERKAAVDARRRAARAEASASRDQAARDNLARLGERVARIEATVADVDVSLADAERQLRAGRQALNALPPLPSKRDREEMTRRLRAGVGALLGRVRELREFADWQRWANLGVQEELCREMEALESPADGAPVPDAEEITRRFTDIMKRWRQVADVPRERGQAAWERFKAAHDRVRPQCEPVFAEQQQQEERNLAARAAIAEEAERLSESSDWLKTAQRLTALQAEWKTLGPAPRKEQRVLWSRFRAACNLFFTRRKTDLAGRKEQWAANLKRKEALCERVEALRNAEDLAAAIEEVKRAQAEWKTVGPVRRSRSEAVWQRFRAACDGVFERLTEGERQADAERIAAREALCIEVEALLSDDKSVVTAAAADAPTNGHGTATPTAPDLVAAIRDVQDRWRHAPEAPPEVRRRLATRFSRAVASLIAARPDQFRGTDLDPARRLRQLEKLCAQAEALMPREKIQQAGASPAEILARKWRDQMAANTMGARVDPVARQRAIREDVKRLQAERRKIGPLTGSAAETLQDRFQRACDRAFRETPSPAAP